MPIFFEDVLKFAITLISILNPLGVIPIFIELTRRNTNAQIKTITNTCAFTVVVVITLSLLIGQQILGFFGISIASFTIGGGLLIFSMAFSMIQAKQSDAKLNENERTDIDLSREIAIVPLAIPLLSGPGVISTSIIQAKFFTSTAHWIGAFLVVLLTGIFVKLILTYSRKIGEKIGTIGLNVMTRVMGIILLAISIEMILGGVKEIMPILKGSFLAN